MSLTTCTLHWKSSAIPGWTWLKAPLPSNLGGLSIRRASLHAAAAFLGLIHHSQHLVERILGYSFEPSPRLQASLDALTSAAAWPDWKTSMYH